MPVKGICGERKAFAPKAAMRAHRRYRKLMRKVAGK